MMSKKIKIAVAPTASPSSTDDFAGYAGSCIDSYERKQFEDHLSRIQRMDALEELSRGFAHDLNNIMTVIKGNAEYLKMKRAEDAFLVRTLNEILAASDRAVQLSSNMTAQLSCPEIVDLNQVITPGVVKDTNRKEHSTPDLTESPTVLLAENNPMVREAIRTV